MDDFTVLLIVGILFALICAAMANSRGRSVPLWGVLGFCFGLLAVIALLVLGRPKP